MLASCQRSTLIELTKVYIPDYDSDTIGIHPNSIWVGIVENGRVDGVDFYCSISDFIQSWYFDELDLQEPIPEGQAYIGIVYSDGGGYLRVVKSAPEDCGVMACATESEASA